MRKFLILIAALTVSSCLLAQENKTTSEGELFSKDITTIKEGKGELMRFHGSLVFSETNDPLLANDVTGEFWRKYRSARILQDYGQYLWMMGLSYMATDAVFAVIYRNGVYNFFKDPSMIVGALCTLAGGAMDFGAWVRLGNLAKTYNTDSSVRKAYSLNIGPTRSGGFGLSLNF